LRDVQTAESSKFFQIGGANGAPPKVLSKLFIGNNNFYNELSSVLHQKRTQTIKNEQYF